METEKIFKTKTGFCHILPDRIVLTQNGIIGNTTSVTVDNNILRYLFLYTLLSAGLFYLSFDNYKNGRTFQAILFALIGIYLAYGVITSINNSAATSIQRDKIRKVKYKKAIVGLTRSRFEVFFEDENGKVKKRLIMLSGSLTDGQNETAKAIKIMKDEKLMSNL